MEEEIKNNTDKNLDDLDIEELKKELELTQKMSEDHLAGWQRARADYSNLKKENERRQQEIFEFANAAAMSEIIPIYNHFKLALRHIPEDSRKLDWVKGLDFIRKQFADFLKKFNIEEIKTVGEKFDPNFHEAIECEEKEGCKEGIIYEEIMPGYKLGDKVIEPAKVKVGK